MEDYQNPKQDYKILILPRLRNFLCERLIHYPPMPHSSLTYAVYKRLLTLVTLWFLSHPLAVMTPQEATAQGVPHQTAVPGPVPVLLAEKHPASVSYLGWRADTRG